MGSGPMDLNDDDLGYFEGQLEKFLKAKTKTKKVGILTGIICQIENMMEFYYEIFVDSPAEHYRMLAICQRVIDYSEDYPEIDDYCIQGRHDVAQIMVDQIKRFIFKSMVVAANLDLEDDYLP